MPGSKSSKSSRISKRKGKAAAAGGVTPSGWLPPFLLLLTLGVLSAGAAAWFLRQGYLLYYGDASAHLSIARRILDSRTPGYEQIGTVWLPLPHVLLLPFVRVDAWWRSGVAGSLASGTCFVAAGMLLYGAARRQWNSVAAGVTAALLLALNPNVLYLQSLAMTEAVFFACTGLTLYALVRNEGGASWVWALTAGVGVCGATLTRYEGWFFIPFVCGYFLLRGGLGLAVLFGAVASAGPVYWMAHNAIFHGDWLAFYRGPGSAMDIQGEKDYPGKGDWDASLYYFSAAAKLIAGTPLLALAGAGAAVAAAFRRAWGVAFLALAPVFYILSLHSSGTPIFLPHLWPHGYYNSRYGLAIMPLAAFAAAGLAGAVPGTARRWAAMAVIAIGAMPWVFYPKAEGWITWKESEVNSESRRAWTRETADYLASHYQRGEGIVTPFGDMTAVYREAGIPLRETVHDGNGLYFQAILQRPDLFLWPQWVVAVRGDALDRMLLAQGSKLPRYERVKMVEVKGAAPIGIYRRIRP